MKKIKKKKAKVSRVIPAFVVGYTNADAPAPGFLTAWFNQAYGGPLNIQFTRQFGHSQFDAMHTQWGARVDTDLPQDTTDTWRERLQWGHSQLAEVIPIHPNMGQDKRDVVLHVARMARGLTLLTEGTAYDVAMGSFLNPSDWKDRQLDEFHIKEHVGIEQKEHLESGRVWFHTRGLSKFGLEEIEVFRARGLPEEQVIEVMMDIAEMFAVQGKEPKVGENLILAHTGRLIEVVRHRTDQSYGVQLNLREVTWE